MSASQSRRTASAVFVAAGLAAAIVALVVFLAFPARHHAAPPSSPEPYGPIRSISEVSQNAPTLAGQLVRVRGRIVGLRDLNTGERFPWDVVYTVDDGTGKMPVHWFVQEQHPQALQPPVLPGGAVIVTGKVKRDLELNGKTYPVILHEQAELHNQEHPTLPTRPTLR